jgi:hypothetical protein
MSLASTVAELISLANMDPEERLAAEKLRAAQSIYKLYEVVLL